MSEAQALIELIVACGYSRDKIKVVRINDPDNKCIVHNGEKIRCFLSNMQVGYRCVVPADRSPPKFWKKAYTIKNICSKITKANQDIRFKTSFKSPYLYLSIERIK